jgi:deoxycytidine triphosphate deaminase
VASAPGVITGVLPHQEILRLCGLKGNQLAESSTGPIRPCCRENVRSASYDLRLGFDYRFAAPLSDNEQSGSMKISSLVVGRDEQIVIPPNQVVVVSSLEKICVPTDMIGHITLKQDILLKGLIMASQSQIDAGYEGWIYPLFYNLTDQPVNLKLKQSIIRLELVRLQEPTNEPYDGHYQNEPLSGALREPFGSSLAKLRKEVEEASRKVRRAPWIATIATIAAIAVPFGWGYLSGFVGEVRDTNANVARLEGELQSGKSDSTFGRLEKRVAELQCEQRQKDPQAKRNRC